MKILVTGCNGQLGREIINQLESKKTKGEPIELLKCDKESLDISNFEDVYTYILEKKPEVIINCAAFTNVDLSEEKVDLAYKINALGSKNLAIASEKVKSKLVYISTDYVFKGDKKTPYREDDTTNPTNIYGKSKFLGEQYTKDFCSRYFIIRTAWLYGDGNNFVKTMLRLSESKKEINVVDDQVGSPTSTKELAVCVLNLINTEYYGTYHGTNNGFCSWYEFAKKIFEIKNIDVKVNPITSDKFPSKVNRPSYSVLDNFMLKLIDLDNFKHWEEALEEYLR
nr:dTDP-4-dehydrorhamnose reductase [uncultured Romboutsia sp.]